MEDTVTEATPSQTPAPAVDDDWAEPFVRAFLRALDDEGLRWLILRNQDRLDRIRHDLDVIVHPDDADRVDSVVRSVVRERGLFLLRIRQGFEHHSFDVAHGSLRGRLLIHLDIQTAVAYRGRLLIDADDLFAHRQRTEDGIWALTPGMEAYAILLHAGLHKGALKESYRARIAALADLDPGALERVAIERLGPDVGRRLASVRDERGLLAVRADLARAIDARHPANRWRRPWFVASSGAAMGALRIRPKGVFVVFLGPDGAGKTTTTDMLATMLSDPSGVIPVHRVYLGSGTPILPTRRIRRALRKAHEGPNAVKPIRDVRPRRLRGAVHVMADEITRYWVQVRPKLFPQGIVVADRYAYDVLRVNNRHIRSAWFRRVATTIIPSPDITFFLEGDPEVIAARKQELTVEETKRQQEAYRALASLVPGFRSIDLTVRDDAALRRVARQILDVYAARNGGVAAGGVEPSRSPASGRGPG